MRVLEGHRELSMAWPGAPISASPFPAPPTTPCGLWDLDTGAVGAFSKDTQVESERWRGAPISGSPFRL